MIAAPPIRTTTGEAGTATSHGTEPIVRALGVDDKTVRAARQLKGWAVHPLVATLHDVPTVLAQRDVTPKIKIP